jgi:hypothetical protein
MKMTIQPPTKPGYYWWTNFGEHTPTIMNVTKHGRGLYASNGEYEFVVEKEPEVITEPEDEYDEVVMTIDGIGYYHGSCFWAGPIELPELGGETLQPDSF